MKVLVLMATAAAAVVGYAAAVDTAAIPHLRSNEENKNKGPPDVGQPADEAHRKLYLPDIEDAEVVEWDDETSEISEGLEDEYGYGPGHGGGGGGRDHGSRCSGGYTEVAILFGFDGNANENSWKLEDKRGNKVAAAGPFSKSFNYKTKVWKYFACDGECLKWKVYDSKGDGIDWWDGGAVLLLRDPDSNEYEVEKVLYGDWGYRKEFDWVCIKGGHIPDYNPCDDRPCHNGAECVHTGQKDYKCQCKSGWSGTTCRDRIDYCDHNSNPCRNGGRCISDGWEKYRCECRDGYEGLRCDDIITRKCDYDQCKNGGRCERRGSKWVCDCSRTGFRGDNCEYPIDYCKDHNPCPDGSYCYSTNAQSKGPEYGDYEEITDEFAGVVDERGGSGKNGYCCLF